MHALFAGIPGTGPMAQPVIEMKISNKLIIERTEKNIWAESKDMKRMKGWGRVRRYAVVSDGSDKCLRGVISMVRRMRDTKMGAYLPSSLFILNMSIFSVLKTAFSAPSHKISRPFDGFCSLLVLIYAHNFLTTCGRESESCCTSAARGSLS